MTSSAASWSLSFSHYFSSLVSSLVVVVVVDSRHRRWSRRTKLCGPATEFNDMEKPFFHEKNSKSFRHWHYHHRPYQPPDAYDRRNPRAQPASSSHLSLPSIFPLDADFFFHRRTVGFADSSSTYLSFLPLLSLSRSFTDRLAEINHFNKDTFSYR